MEGVSGILQRIKDFSIGHAVDVRNELLSYDVKKKGIISQVSLYRWLATIGVNLSSRNIQNIVIAYTKGDGIDVYRLIEDIENSSSYNKTISSRPPDCSRELLDLDRELQRRRQNVWDVLKPFDRHNLGHVTSENFYRAFGSSPTTRTIVNCYASGDEIDYLRLGTDIYNTRKSQQGVTTIVIPEPTPAFEKLATYIKSRLIDYRKYMSDYDTLNTGKMTIRQFGSAVSSFGASLSPNEIDEIANTYDDGSGFCNYVLFIKALDKFELPPPKIPEQTLHNIAENSKYIKQQTPDTLLEAAKATIIDRRIEVDHYFRNLEKEGYTGDVIPVIKFSKIITGMHIDLTYDEIESIASIFLTPNGGVRYKDFIRAVSSNNTSRTISSNDVINRLRDHLYETRQQLARVAVRFDRENSGNIASSQLPSVIHFVRFDASPQDIAAIRDAFPGTERNTVSWRNLCQQVDQPIKPYEVSNRQDNEEEGQLRSSRIHVESNPPPKYISSILNKINKATENIDLILQFRERDRFSIGSIPQQTLINFIHSLPINMSQPEYRNLISYYRVTGSSDINYLQLAADAKHAREEEIEAARQEALTRPIELLADPLPPFSQEVHSLIKRLKSFASQRRFPAVSLFKPYDKMNNGTVPLPTVHACFSQVDFPINDNEVQLLQNTFKDVRRPELFNYHLFIKAFNQEDIVSADSRNSISSAPISYELDREALTACSQIREKLLARHRRIEMAFADVTTPTISTEEFQKKLGLFDIVIRASQTSALIRKYRVNLSDEIDWRKFCEDINNTKTI